MRKKKIRQDGDEGEKGGKSHKMEKERVEEAHALIESLYETRGNTDRKEKGE